MSFRTDLPAMGPTLTAAPSVAEPRASDVPAAATVLTVDDEPAVLSALRRLLRRPRAAGDGACRGDGAAPPMRLAARYVFDERLARKVRVFAACERVRLTLHVKCAPIE